MSIKRSKSLLGIIFLAAATLFGSQAMAQDDTTEPSKSAPSIETPANDQAEFPEEKLKSFAVAFLQVDKVTREYLPKLKEAKSAEEQQQVRDEAGAKMLKAVEGTEGISINEYNEIAKSAQTDQTLANKLSRYIREAGE